MQFPNYYKVIGVDESASVDEIKKAYRRLARKFHPDVSKEQDAEERFKEIGEAYAILSDETRKSEYDEMRQYQASGGNFEDIGKWQRQQGNPDSGQQFSDLFESLFRQQGFHEQRQHIDGEDVNYVLPVSIEEAVMGGKRTISYVSLENDANGYPYQKQHSLRVTVPKGVIAGQHLRLNGKGGAGYGNGKPGDLYLEIQLQPHQRFTAEGRNLAQHLPVALWDLALGETVQVLTVDGAVNLKIPANAKPGQKLRIKGKGIPGNPPGDMLVILKLMFPDVVTDDQRALFRTMKQQFNDEKVRRKTA